MPVALVAVHYPHPGRFDVVVGKVRLAAELIGGTPGCHIAHCWSTTDGDAVVAIAEWEDEDASRASFAAARAGGVGFDDQSDERQPRSIYWLTTPEPHLSSRG